MGLDASCDALVDLRGVASLPAAFEGPAAGLLGCRELRVDRLAGEDMLTVNRSSCHEERRGRNTSAAGGEEIGWGRGASVKDGEKRRDAKKIRLC